MASAPTLLTLPAEARQMIWKLALPTPENLEILLAIAQHPIVPISDIARPA
jgi:hypothetical protein